MSEINTIIIGVYEYVYQRGLYEFAVMKVPCYSFLGVGLYYCLCSHTIDYMYM